jgi:hypothetical protein
MESFSPQNHEWNLSVSRQDSPASTQRSSSDLAATVHAQRRLTPWPVDKLRAHPEYARLGISVPSDKLNALLESGEDAFIFPLIVTSSGCVIDGYARLEAARVQRRATVDCVEYDISEEEALRRLLLCHRPSSGLPPFPRVVMARGVGNSSKEKALRHRQAGGEEKALSKLPLSDKVDVRKEIAAAAGVSVGTLSHALEVLRNGDPEIVKALCNGEIKIDRAWRWSKYSRARQRENLQLYKRHRGMERVAQKLIARQIRNLTLRHRQQRPWKLTSSDEAIRGLSTLPVDLKRSVTVVFVRTPFTVLALSEDLGKRLGFREELPSCS